MKILIYSPAFLPGIGGIEIGQSLLADRFTRLGHEVTVATTTGLPAAAGADDFPFRVLRQPSPAALLGAVRASDIFFQANVSLRGLWPLLLVRRPWAVSHHSWYDRGDGRLRWRDRLKRFVLRFAAVSISASEALAADLETPSLVIPNAYRDDLFRRLPGVPRTRDLIFIGRLVSDKGVNLLIAALARLREGGLRPRLLVVGDGPERAALISQVASLGLGEQVEICGMTTGEALVRLLNEHRILVVPSLYHEPFGVVALEGIACGCAVVGSAGGGLPEAIGPCGITFPNGSVDGLAAALAELLRRPEQLERWLAGAPEHLARHGSDRVARLYLAALADGLAASITPRRPVRQGASR
jgi:glycogen(starch) synthase